ncbi:hypothetical protein LY76DRAFT_423739 [Colletotrichum caudatum]|nr:hypothetical protein LY76DRAFT_423739 [Colletotrichum caudatum]
MLCGLRYLDVVRFDEREREREGEGERESMPVHGDKFTSALGWTESTVGWTGWLGTYCTTVYSSVPTRPWHATAGYIPCPFQSVKGRSALSERRIWHMVCIQNGGERQLNSEDDTHGRNARRWLTRTDRQGMAMMGEAGSKKHTREGGKAAVSRKYNLVVLLPPRDRETTTTIRAPFVLDSTNVHI